jgi:hypothetical protein
MQGFNPELKVGMQAMIIGVRYPENAHKIGKVVTIEGLGSIGDVPGWYSQPYSETKLTFDLALVSGIGPTPGILNGMSSIQQKYLMPLPPLDDDNFETDASKSTKQPKEAVKC